jgi:hypothetical protein
VGSVVIRRVTPDCWAGRESEAARVIGILAAWPALWGSIPNIKVLSPIPLGVWLTLTRFAREAIICGYGCVRLYRAACR